MFPVRLTAPKTGRYPEWWQIAYVDPEREDVWIPAYFLTAAEAETLESRGFLFGTYSENPALNGKPFCSARAAIRLRGGWPELDSHRRTVLARALPRPAPTGGLRVAPRPFRPAPSLPR